MELQIVNLEQAKRLKQAGFDWDCFDAFRLVDNEFGKANELVPYQGSNKLSDYASAPTVALALKWIRENYKKLNLYFYIYAEKEHYGYFINKGVEDYYSEMKKNQDGEFESNKDGRFKTYDTAESILLDKLLTLIEKDNEQSN